MPPILILQQLTEDGPAYLADWLHGQGLAFDCVDDEAGQRAPADMSAHAGLIVLGGEMSANDPLPMLRHAEALIRDAMARGKPVLGHCLGGQLMARALGAVVGPSPAPEVGWQTITVAEHATAHDWLGTAGKATVFQWHYESFALPAGSVALARSAACPNQAWALGPHLAMQFHPELDAAKLALWLQDPGSRHAAARRTHPGSVQDADAMRAQAPQGLAAQQALASRLYGRWVQGLAR
jgi:GMP synthase (glutamine-hydrolysing)